MIRIFLGSLFLSMTMACSQNVDTQTPEKPSYTKQDILEDLSKAGLAPQIHSPKKIPRSIKRAFPAEPKEYVFLGVDDEGMWVFRFETIEQAKQMEKNFEDGFRSKEWFFAGLVTVELTNKMKKALR